MKKLVEALRHFLDRNNIHYMRGVANMPNVGLVIVTDDPRTAAEIEAYIQRELLPAEAIPSLRWPDATQIMGIPIAVRVPKLRPIVEM